VDPGDAKEPSPVKTRRGLSRPTRLAAAVVLAVTLLACGFLVFGARSARDSHDVGIEAVKAGFQLLVLVAAGLGVTGLLNWLAKQQDDRHRVNDATLLLLRDLIDSYNRMKAARRTLRAIGLQDPAPYTAMSAAQAQEFELQMRTLMDVQLSFEAIGRLIDAQVGEDPHASEAHQAPHQRALSRMELYVRQIVEEWEKRGADMAASGYALSVVSGLTCLQGFLATSHSDPKQDFRTNTSDCLRELEEFFRQNFLVIFPGNAEHRERRRSQLLRR
jgi:hypothetical protein